MPHRVLVWGAALLCVVLLLLAARCLSSQPKHAQTRGASRHRQVLGRLPQAPQYPDPDREVLYSDVLHGAWSKPGAAREPPQPTVYSTLRYGEEA